MSDQIYQYICQTLRKKKNKAHYWFFWFWNIILLYSRIFLQRDAQQVQEAKGSVNKDVCSTLLPIQCVIQTSLKKKTKNKMVWKRTSGFFSVVPFLRRCYLSLEPVLKDGNKNWTALL